MDAAHMLKKTALLLSAALAFAAPSFAQILVGGGTTTTVTLNGSSPSTLSVTSGGSSPLTYTIGSFVPGVGGFNISASADQLTTPATLTLAATQFSCATATSQGAAYCTGTLTLTGSDSSHATITVNFSNGTGGGGGGGGGSSAFSISQNPVSLAPGGAQFLTLNNGTAASVTYSVGFPSASWLQTFPAPGSTNNLITANGSVQFYVSATGYTTGQPTSATVVLTPSNTAPAITLTVTITGTSTSGGLAASPSPLGFSYPSGTISSYVTVTNANGNNSTTYYASATTQTGGNWLALLGPTSASTAQLVGSSNSLLVTVNTAAVNGILGTGTYYGTVYLYDGTSSALLGQFSVTLSVNGGSGGTGGVAAPASLTYTYQTGGSAPYQVILVNGGVSNASFTASTGNWTNSSVTPTWNSASNQVYVSVPSGLAAGTYTGTVTVTNTSGLIQGVGITLNVYATGITLLINPGGPGDYTCTYVAGQQNCGSASYTISASDGSSISISASSSVSWTTVSCSSPTTPSTCTVQVNASGLSNGLNTGAVTVTANNTTTNGSVQIPIAVLVSGSSGGTGSLTFSPTSLSFTTTSTASQTVTVTSSQGGAVVFSTATDQNWLYASASNANTTPSTLTVTVNAAGLPTGNYSGNVNLTVGGTQQQIPVTLTVSATVQTLTVTSSGGTQLNATTGLSFASQQGGSSPSAQSINIATTSGATGAVFTYSTSASWLMVNSVTSGTSAAPTTLPVSVNPSGLTASSTPYSGTVTITPTGGTAVTFPVSYTLSPGQTVSASPTSLTFSYTAGSGNPPSPQTINATGNGTFSATATSTGNWCQVSPTSGTAPTSLTVSLTNLDSLTVNQSYTCTITVAGTGNTAGSTTITATLTVTAPLPTIIKVTNAASFNAGSISAGEIITIFGTAIGPTTGVSAAPSNGVYPTTLGGVQVLVGGFPAAMIYASATQVSAAVPYEINKPAFLQSPSVQVRYLGQNSNGVSLTQVAAAPGIFTANSSGSGPGAILNSNLSVNSSSNPASPGSTVVLYVTGEGQTIPAGVTGKVTSSTAPFTVPVQAPTVTINGQPAQVSFYAEAPALIAGVLQINVVIPQSAGTGDLPVVVSLGSASSQLTAAGIGAVTVSVH